MDKLNEYIVCSVTVDRSKLFKLMFELNSNKSIALTICIRKLLRDTASIIIVAESLTFSLNSGIILEALKVANVIPVYKKEKSILQPIIQAYICIE
jgi:hypothetical protein